MPALTGASAVLCVVKETEKVNVPVDGVGVIPQLFATVGTVQKIREDMLFRVVRFGRPSFCSGCQLLHPLEGIPVDNGFMPVLENGPVFLGFSRRALFLKDLKYVLKLTTSPQYS